MAMYISVTAKPSKYQLPHTHTSVRILLRHLQTMKVHLHAIYIISTCTLNNRMSVYFNTCNCDSYCMYYGTK